MINCYAFSISILVSLIAFDHNIDINAAAVHRRHTYHVVHVCGDIQELF